MNVPEPLLGMISPSSVSRLIARSNVTRETPIEKNSDDVTDDAFLGGRLHILQPARKGYRAGLDAVLAAAAVQCWDMAECRILDAGAGVGTLGLCVAANHPTACITLVENDPLLLDLAAKNISRNGLANTRGMHPYLVGTTGLQFDFHQTGGFSHRQRPKNTQGRFPFQVHPDNTLPRAQYILAQGCVDLAAAPAPLSLQQGKIAFINPVTA